MVCHQHHTSLVNFAVNAVLRLRLHLTRTELAQAMEVAMPFSVVVFVPRHKG
jgi:hypothetical protein